MKLYMKVAALLVPLFLLAFNAGCTANGVDISLENLELGAVTMDGKPVAGLPSQKVNLLIHVAARKVVVTYDDDGTTLMLSPSDAAVEIKNGGISIKGATADQVKIEWATTHDASE